MTGTRHVIESFSLFLFHFSLQHPPPTSLPFNLFIIQPRYQQVNLTNKPLNTRTRLAHSSQWRQISHQQLGKFSLLACQAIDSSDPYLEEPDWQCTQYPYARYSSASSKLHTRQCSTELSTKSIRLLIVDQPIEHNAHHCKHSTSTTQRSVSYTSYETFQSQTGLFDLIFKSFR